MSTADKIRLLIGRAILYFVGLAYEEEIYNRSRFKQIHASDFDELHMDVVKPGRTSLQRDCERLFRA